MRAAVIIRAHFLIDVSTMMSSLIPLILVQETEREAAARLAERLGLPLRKDMDPRRVTDSEFVLVWDEQGLALQQTGSRAPGPVRVDFTAGAVDHRRRQGGGKGQMIAKAVGLGSGIHPRVLDATAGLGKDAFVLASLGCEVRMLERSPIVHALLSDGLRRAHLHAAETCDEDLARILQRLSLVAGDARGYLESLAQASAPQVIYLDPMFPERDKSAEVKKDMRAFHTLVGRDEDADELLALALVHARNRVVVKRSRRAPFLAGRAPGYQLEGKSSRFDIYPMKKLTAENASTSA